MIKEKSILSQTIENGGISEENIPKSSYAKIASISMSTGMTNLLSNFYAGIGAIFMLHRICKPDQQPVATGLATTTKFIDSYLSYLIRKRIDIISIEEAVDRIQQGDTSGSSRFAVFTFDDGYRDNLTLAAPIFERYRVPYTVYITKDFINRNMYYWWGGIEEIVKSQNNISFEKDGVAHQLPNDNIALKRANYQLLTELLNPTDSDSKEQLNSMFKRYGVDLCGLQDAHAMTEKEVIELSRHPGVTIGAHTVTHRSLCHLDENELTFELKESRNYLETLLDQSVDHFSFPYGETINASDRESKVALQCGFRSAVTTRNGTIKKAHKQLLTALPRLWFRFDREYISYMEYQRNGLYTQMRQKSLFPVIVN